MCLLIRFTGKRLVLVKSRCDIFEVYRSGAFCFVYTCLLAVFIYAGLVYMPNFSYSYPHRSGMAVFHITRVRRPSGLVTDFIQTI